MPAQKNHSLIDGLTVLQELVASPRPVGSREMAQRLGMEHTRVNRLLGTLSLIGMAEQTADRKYRPGPGVHVLAAQSLHGSLLLTAALPHLSDLRDALPDHTIALGVRWRQYVSFVLHARPGTPLTEAIGTHGLELVNHSSIGVALLAGDDREEVAEIIERAVTEGAGDGSLPDPPLAEAITAARANGYARHRYRSGTVSVAVAVGDPPPVAGIAASAVLTEPEVERTVAHLRETAARVTESMTALAQHRQSRTRNRPAPPDNE